jgi:hypothetical protein
MVQLMMPGDGLHGHEVRVYQVCGGGVEFEDGAGGVVHFDLELGELGTQVTVGAKG